MPLHLITGLPRSGTTLLGAILRQNPRFSGGMTTPLQGLLDNALGALSPMENEAAIEIEDKRRKQILKYIVDGWLAGYPKNQVVFDTNRFWASRLPLIEELMPDAKVIVCVRNPAWVLDSFERIFRENPMRISTLYGGPEDRHNVYSRAELLGRPNRIIGRSLNSAKEAFYSPQSDRLMVLDYDLLAALPDQVMKLFYQFIEEPFYQHNFNKVVYSADAVDEFLGAPRLHTVKRKVEPSKRKTVLPPDLFDLFASKAFWGDVKSTRAKVIMPAQDQPV